MRHDTPVMTAQQAWAMCEWCGETAETIRDCCRDSSPPGPGGRTTVTSLTGWPVRPVPPRTCYRSPIAYRPTATSGPRRPARCWRKNCPSRRRFGLNGFRQPANSTGPPRGTT